MDLGRKKMNEHEMNELGQPVGLAVPGWAPPPHPASDSMVGRFCRLESLDPERHGRDLYDANRLDAEGRNWTYLPYGPFESLEDYLGWMKAACMGRDPLFFSIIDRKTGKAAGLASLMRIDPKAGSIEIGHLNFSPLLQRKPAATEAIYMMMRRAFETGYRRCEWKCNALNAASRSAAQRFGFSFEGVFRQAVVVKGRNRDTAWYAAMDHEWPEISKAFVRWLDPANFDDRGNQIDRLGSFTRSCLSRIG